MADHFVVNFSASGSQAMAVTSTACSLGLLSSSEQGAVRSAGLSAGYPKEVFLQWAVS